MRNIPQLIPYWAALLLLFLWMADALAASRDPKKTSGNPAGGTDSTTDTTDTGDTSP